MPTLKGQGMPRESPPTPPIHCGICGESGTSNPFSAYSAFSAPLPMNSSNSGDGASRCLLLLGRDLAGVEQ